MRTRASIKSHPMHAMLIAFPITFFTTTVALDLLGVLLDRPGWWHVGYYSAIVGVISALVAGTPGTIDYLFTIPPGSSAKKRATYHMLVNLTVTALFLIAWTLRDGPTHRPGWLTLALEVVGSALLGLGGWLGATLIYRNFIGPEHRYADKGRWSETRVGAKPGEAVAVADVGDLGVDHMRLVHVGGRRIVIARTADGYRAFTDHCCHRGASLADGVLINGKVQCLWHGSRFDVTTGACECGPAKEPISTYPVEVKDGKVLVRV